MKKATLIIALLFVTTMINAQNYQISFTGSGESTNVETVFVENLTQGTTLELAGTDILHLVGTVGISSQSDINLDLNIYPNPMQGTSKIEFYSDKPDDVKIEIFDLNGRLVVSHSGDLHTGINGFEISGFSQGFYSVNVITSAHQTSANFISTNDDAKTPAIKAIDQGMIDSQAQAALKSTKNLVQMQYNDGERLLFKGVSGDYARVLTIIPTQSQSVNFEFVPCTDLDGDNYAVVTIGEQTWMAENLKYLPSVNAYAPFNSTIYPHYYVYSYWGSSVSEAKATDNYNTYGVLYNWVAAMDSATSSNTNPSWVRGVCPEGWHLPSDAEWSELTDFLGGAGVAGGKLKEIGDSHWFNNTGATNEYGFTALGAGYIPLNSQGDMLKVQTRWWSTTEASNDIPWYIYLSYNSDNLSRTNTYSSLGHSVRCIKNSNSSFPQADFNVNQTEIFLGESVQFMDISTNNPTDWQWDLGDGNTSTEQNPAHTYVNAGTYTISLTVSNAFESDTEVKNDYITVISNTWPTDTETEVVEVTNPTTGQIWMDRNLGASQVATSSTDTNAYGDLYQWGRAADGHQLRTSVTTSTLSNSDTLGHSNFITTSSSTNDWRSPQNNSFWQGVIGINNPCPSGYRLPTVAEWEAELASWSSSNAAGAFTSPLRLPVAGYRNYGNGELYEEGAYGYYWSSTVSDTYSHSLDFDYYYAYMHSNSNRAYGHSVRCIKNIPSPHADFSANQTEIFLGESVQFTDISTNNPTDWQWEFGDGNTSTEQNPSHTYENVGTYTVSLTVTNVFGSDTEEKNEFIFIETEVVEVTNPITGEIWMDRNLGVSQAATSSNDVNACGDLYQWGRAADGHQLRTSETTSTLATSNIPGHGNFITTSSSPCDWRSPQNDTLWQGVSGTNNPCPSGYRLPTMAEWEEELASWISSDAAGAFASQLKLPVAGYRKINGSFSDMGYYGYYWSSTVSGTNSRHLTFSNNNAYVGAHDRATGRSVRCIKDNNPSSPQADFNANQTEISLGETVQFTDISTNNPTDWQWDFGDGNTSTEQNPAHAYENVGIYTVSLAISNAFGSDTETKTDYIIVTPANGTFTDSRDGNEYQTINIGGQEWMAENLKYLPSVVGPGTDSQTTPYYYVYGYDGTNVTDAKATANYDTYGVLYNWPAAMDGAASSSSNPSGVQGVCPTGWHLPSDDEWKELEMALGMSQVEADEMDFRGTNEGSKLAGNTGLWADSELESDADFGTSGFTALPGGYRSIDGAFSRIGSSGFWYSATLYTALYPLYRNVEYDYSNVNRELSNKDYGFSVRCVRD